MNPEEMASEVLEVAAVVEANLIHALDLCMKYFHEKDPLVVGLGIALAIRGRNYISDLAMEAAGGPGEDLKAMVDELFEGYKNLGNSNEVH